MISESHRVLFIPELLDIIFNFLDRDSNIVNARVCKRWSEIALDVVWKEVDDLIYLFRLLKPICQQEDMFEYVSCLRLLLQFLSHLALHSTLRHSHKPATGPGSKSMPLALDLSSFDPPSTISKYALC